MNTSLIASPVGVMTALIAVVSFWFWLQKTTNWKVFNYLPPLIWLRGSRSANSAQEVEAPGAEKRRVRMG